MYQKHTLVHSGSCSTKRNPSRILICFKNEPGKHCQNQDREEMPFS
ncbi:hypothetical protein L798_00841 [Zootermopsis nevadensis]|uniref:Uncharacterized protein n=1 Tax=Zootermopsis nevadensis TaxID=136037 RepID=A0A067QMS8_ZOONE|nr:hypothetical protein L798_00841 [Zootermopsis nevadensis]